MMISSIHQKPLIVFPEIIPSQEKLAYFSLLGLHIICIQYILLQWSTHLSCTCLWGPIYEDVLLITVLTDPQTVLLHNKHSANASGFYKISVVTTGANTILFFLDSGTNLITKNILILKTLLILIY